MENHTPHTPGHERFPALYVRDFRIFWMGQLISFSGTWMQSTAQGWLVYSLTLSSFYLGLVAAAASVPVLFFTLLGGVVADRLMKRRVLIVTQILSIIPAVSLALLVDFEVVTVWQIAVFATMLGTINAFDVPARQSFLVEMVQKGRLLNAIALNSAAFNGARILGPFFAGIAIASVGIAACFYVNALSFLAAIMALLLIRTGRDNAPGESQAGPQELRAGVVVEDLAEGLRFVLRDRYIFRIVSIIALFSLFGIPYITLLPVFARDILDVGPKGLGILSGSSGAGAFVAALIIAFKGDVERRGRLLVAAGTVFSIALFFFSVSREYSLSALMLLFAGWGMVSFLAVSNSFIQLTIPDALRGRVMSVYALVFLGVAPLGNAVMGSLAHLIGAEKAVSLGSLLCLVAVLGSSKLLLSMDRPR